MKHHKNLSEKEFRTKYGTIQYIDYNTDNEIPIFYIHGLGCCGSNDYIEIAKSLHLKEYRHIIIDLLGSGLSDKPLNFDYTLKNHARYLVDFTEHMGFDKLILYGHSMGGYNCYFIGKLNKRKNTIYYFRRGEP